VSSGHLTPKPGGVVRAGASGEGRLGQAGLVCAGRHEEQRSASKHQAVSYAHISRREAEVGHCFGAAEPTGRNEDKPAGDELPGWSADKQKRLAKILEAKAELDVEARAAAEAECEAPVETEVKRIEGSRVGGRTLGAPQTGCDVKVQRNLTEPGSGILNTKHSCSHPLPRPFSEGRPGRALGPLGSTYSFPHRFYLGD